MAYPRSYLNLTPLPDGTVLATGGGTTTNGGDVSDGVLPAEDWDPATGQWTTWASMAEPRLYHSIAMLMPDGTVLVAGTGDLPGVPNEFNAQIFSPPYLFNGPRPTITSSPSVVQYGSNFQVSTPDAASITSVSLIRTAAVTHSFDESTRRVSLPFTASNGVLNVQAPANGADAPPGNYMLFIVNSNGVPSVASWVHLPAPYTEDGIPPSAPSGLTATATSSSSVSLSWTASTDNVGVTGYNILRNGVQVGTSTTTSYTDNTVASNTAYTYTVIAYDAAGNISTPSNSATVTTPQEQCPCSIWQDGTPTGSFESNDPSAQTLGVQFQAASSGFITGVRFYKEADDTGAHIGSLWSSTGTLLASGTFSNETASRVAGAGLLPPGGGDRGDDVCGVVFHQYRVSRGHRAGAGVGGDQRAADRAGRRRGLRLRLVQHLPHQHLQRQQLLGRRRLLADVGRPVRGRRRGCRRRRVMGRRR